MSDGSVYAIVGSGVRGPGHLVRACRTATVVACNLACMAIEADVVLIVERDAARKYRDQIGKAMAKGARLRVSRHASTVFNTKGDPWKMNGDFTVRYQGDEYVRDSPRFGPSGAVGIQWALDQGATEIRMVGLSGYGPQDMCGPNSYGGGKHRMYLSNGLQQNIIEFCVRGCPGVEFVMYGETVYELPVSDNFQQVLS